MLKMSSRVKRSIPKHVNLPPVLGLTENDDRYEWPTQEIQAWMNVNMILTFSCIPVLSFITLISSWMSRSVISMLLYVFIEVTWLTGLAILSSKSFVPALKWASSLSRSLLNSSPIYASVYLSNMMRIQPHTLLRSLEFSICCLCIASLKSGASISIRSLRIIKSAVEGA